MFDFVSRRTADGFTNKSFWFSVQGRLEIILNKWVECVPKQFETQLLPGSTSMKNVRVGKVQTIASQKEPIISWLKRIVLMIHHRQKEAFQTELKKKPSETYNMDELATSHEHKAVCLPLYRCYYNTIEFTRYQIKRIT